MRLDHRRCASNDSSTPISSQHRNSCVNWPFIKPLYNLALRVSQRATCKVGQNRPELPSDCAFQKPIRMSRTSHGGRSRTWHFSRILHASLLPEAISGLSQTSSSKDPGRILSSQFQKLFMTDKRPDCISYIHLRVAQAAFEKCVWSGSNSAPLPDLQFTGYIQAKDTIDLSRLRSWLDGQWNSVGGKLICLCPLPVWLPRDFKRCDRRLLSCISLCTGSVP